MRRAFSSNRRGPIAALLAAVLLGATGGFTWAADAPAAPEPSKELREKIAVLHEQMAACLRSDKAVSECRTAMMKGCHELGGQGCMAGMGGMMGGHMGKGHMSMQPQ